MFTLPVSQNVKYHMRSSSPHAIKFWISCFVFDIYVGRIAGSEKENGAAPRIGKEAGTVVQ